MPRLVQPEVFLVSKPALNVTPLANYVDERGGTEWFDRVIHDSVDAAGENAVEFGGRMCYRSWAPGLNANVTRVREDSHEYLQNIVKSGHGSVLEHANYGFVFKNVSRVFTHELVRHRAGSAFSQESFRYVRLTDLPFWMPEWAYADREVLGKVWEALEYLEDLQKWFSDHFDLDSEESFHVKKQKTSFMRRLAPEGVTTDIFWTANVRTIRHVVAARTDSGAEEEIRTVFANVGKIMRTEVPALWADMHYSSETGEWTSETPKV